MNEKKEVFSLAKVSVEEVKNGVQMMALQILKYREKELIEEELIKEGLIKLAAASGQTLEETMKDLKNIY